MPLFEGCLGPYASFLKKQYQKVWKYDAPLDAILEGCLGRELNFRRKKVSKQCDAIHAWKIRDLVTRRRFPVNLTNLPYLNQRTPASRPQGTQGIPFHLQRRYARALVHALRAWRARWRIYIYIYIYIYHIIEVHGVYTCTHFGAWCIHLYIFWRQAYTPAVNS